MKQKTPIILPGFESVSVSDELSGQYSVSWRSGIVHYLLHFLLCINGSCCFVQSESSQLETKISGIPLSTGKKDSLFGNAAELKDKSTLKSSKNVSVSFFFFFFLVHVQSSSTSFGQQVAQCSGLLSILTSGCLMQRCE